MPALVLQVNEHNRTARMSYERLGFLATGEWEELESGYRRETMRMELPGCR